MRDHIARIFLLLCCLVLAVSYARYKQPAVVMVSDNGIVPPDLLTKIAVEDAAEDAVLNQPLSNLDLENSDLDGAIGKLVEQSKAKIEVRWKVLEGGGVDRLAPVHVQRRHGTVGMFVKNIIDSAAGGTAKFDYQVAGNVIVISTAEDLNRHRTTEIYNLQPLIDKVQHSQLTDPADKKPEDAIRCIDHMIMDVVASDSWDDAGGLVGNMRNVGPLLIVTQTLRNQREVAKLLTQIDAEMKK